MEISNATTASAKKTPYQLVTQPNVHQEEFLASDLKVTKERYHNVFFHQSVGDDIFEAIASKGGKSDPRNNQAS